MKSSRPFTGTLTALVTPFDRRGAVAYEDLERLVDHQVRSGVDGLVSVGTTGESPTLDHEEHLEVIRATIAAARGRVPVVAGTGSNSTREALHLTRESDRAGADAMLVVAPYYNKPTQEGLFGYFSAIADATDKPIILYSIPGRCGVEIGVPVIARLRARYPHVAHVKEAGGSVDRVDQILQACGNSVTVLSGDDSLTLPFLAVGAQGVVSVASNLYPREVVRLVRWARAGESARARALHRRLYPMFRAIFIEANPVPIKAALARRGLIRSAQVRPPLCGLRPESRAELFRTLDALEPKR